MNFISDEFDLDNLVLTIGLDKYSIYPGDATFVCLWLPTTNVKVIKNESKQIMHPYNLLITNLVTKEVAHAFKIGG